MGDAARPSPRGRGRLDPRRGRRARGAWRCERLGVRHFTRKGRPAYNQPSGPFRARSKAGNHNAWRAEHARHYDVVARWTPTTSRSRPSWSAPSGTSATRTRRSSSPRRSTATRARRSSPAAPPPSSTCSVRVSRAGNGLGAPLLIGTNHLYRPAAWHQIGGYQDSVTEDHLTGMGPRHRQPGHRAPVARRLHPRRAGDRRGADDLDRLLQPAEALGVRHREIPASTTEGATRRMRTRQQRLGVLRAADALPDQARSPGSAVLALWGAVPAGAGSPSRTSPGLWGAAVRREPAGWSLSSRWA